VPTAKVLVVHFAVRLFPDPATAIAEQPPIELAPSMKFTVPVGTLPVIVAVKVTLPPVVEGVIEVVSAVVLAAGLMTWDIVALVDPALLASPL